MNIISELTQTLVNAVQGLIDKLYAIPVGIWDTISSAWSVGLSGVEAAIEAVGSVIDTVVTAAQSLYDLLIDIIEAIANIIIPPWWPGQGSQSQGGPRSQSYGDNLVTQLSSLPSLSPAGAGGGDVYGTFNTTINDKLDQEEFYYRVQEAQRAMM